MSYQPHGWHTNAPGDEPGRFGILWTEQHRERLMASNNTDKKKRQAEIVLLVLGIAAIVLLVALYYAVALINSAQL